ncbi:MAG: hypothetical protein LBI14_08065 [Treponema sp.]|jgi:hypothetical protein|nr:hypothetical protein [Treponema sp.]
MKNKGVFLFVLTFTFVFMSGCYTAVPYSFAENESGNGTATITFLSEKTASGVDLHYFEGIELPMPERKKYWAPVTFPAGRPFALTVNVYYSNTDYGTEVIFNCPALTAGKSYTLGIEIRSPRTFLGRTIVEMEEKLVLRDKKTKVIVYEELLTIR